MLWTALVLWTLAGFIAGSEDSESVSWYPGRRKLASIDLDEYGYDDSSREYDDDNDPLSREDYNSRYRVESVKPESKEKKLRKDIHLFENPHHFLRNYLTHTKLSLYNRHKKIEVIPASEWFKNFDFNKDLVILVHGVLPDQNYVEDFFNTVAFALLYKGDYNVIGIDWRHFLLKERDIFDIERNAEEAIKIGHVLNSITDRAMKTKNLEQVPRTRYIGHGLGNIPVVVQSLTYGFEFDTVYGLEPRAELGSHNYLTLTQMHGKLVHTLSTLPYPHSLSHRDYKPIYHKDFDYKGSKSYLAYQLLANAIVFGNMTARFCSSERDYLNGLCSRLAEVPLWYTQISQDCKAPIGRYFYELPLPRLRPYCDGQAFVEGAYD